MRLLRFAATFAAVAACIWWMARQTGAAPLTLLATFAWAVFVFVPVGGLITHLALRTRRNPAIRFPLILGVGFMLTPSIVMWLGGWHRLAWYPAVCAVLWLPFLYLEWRSPASSPRPWPARAGQGLILITVLSLVAVTPLLRPLERRSDGSFVDNTSIDKFYHLNLVRSLTRNTPLADWPDMAGSPPEFYPLHHHVYEATLARALGIDAQEASFILGPMLLVILTILLSYAIGLVATGSSWAGYAAASLQFLVLVPNWYDRNLLLVPQSVTLLPNFYQLHFYGLRYAAHSVSGDVVILVTILAAFIALSKDDDRGQVGGLALMGLGAAMLLHFRPQFALAVIPSSVLLQLGFLAWKRQARFVIPLAVLAFVVLVSLLSQGSESSSTGIVFQYGVFGESVLGKGYLPDLGRAAIAVLPAIVRPAAGIAALLVLRIVGFNHLLLIGWGVLRSASRATLRWHHAYLLLMMAFAAGAAAFVEQTAWAANIGMNILMTCRMPILILLALIVLDLARRFANRSIWLRAHRGMAGAAVLVGFTFIAYRGADAAMHDWPERAYPLTERELAAYQWVRTQTSEDAVVAAHPDHKVNEAGERIRDTNFLSGMSGRAVYLQRVTPFLGPEADRRAELLERLFAARSPDDTCNLVRSAHFDYLIEYQTETLATRDVPCLERVYTGNPNVYARR